MSDVEQRLLARSTDSDCSYTNCAAHSMIRNSAGCFAWISNSVGGGAAPIPEGDKGQAREALKGLQGIFRLSVVTPLL